MSEQIEPKIDSDDGRHNVREDIETLSWLSGLAVKELRELDPVNDLLKFAQQGEIVDEAELIREFFLRFGEGEEPNATDPKFMFKVAEKFYSALDKEVKRLKSLKEQQ